MSTTGTPQRPKAEKQRTPEERQIIVGLERYFCRKPTEQEIHLSLEQARVLGEL